MTDEKPKPKLTLIPCDRTAFDYEIRRALWIGTNDELDAAIEKLKPRGKLSLVSKQLLARMTRDSKNDPKRK